jgi:hypothetical protein
VHFNCELSQFTHHLAVKTRDALWLQSDRTLVPLCGADAQLMPDKIELDFESARAIRNQ